jgi:hypothetical protein
MSHQALPVSVVFDVLSFHGRPFLVSSMAHV